MDEILPPGCLRQTAQMSAVDCDCGPPCFKDILSAWGGSALVCLSLEARWTKGSRRGTPRERQGEVGWAREARHGCRHGNGGETNLERCAVSGQWWRIAPTQPIRGKCKMCQKMLRLQPATSSRWRSQVRSAIAQENRLFLITRQRGFDTQEVSPRAWPLCASRCFVRLGSSAGLEGLGERRHQRCAGGRVGRLTNSPNY